MTPSRPGAAATVLTVASPRPMEFNLADLFECVVDHVADRVALSCGDRHLDYATLDDHANRLAHGLDSLGICAADHVACHHQTGPDSLEPLMACFKLRALPI